MLSERLLRGLLALEILKRLGPGEGSARISELGSRYRGALLREKLSEMAEGGLVRLEGDLVYASDAQKLELALFAIENGVAFDSVGKAMDWRGFEDLAEEILKGMGFKCFKHLRFKIDRRSEIDLLAIGPLFSLSIDCKRWRSASRGEILKAAEAQRRRTMELRRWLEMAGPDRTMGLSEEAPLFPVVLTLQDHGIGIRDGVAIVPILKLRDFAMRADPLSMAP